MDSVDAATIDHLLQECSRHHRHLCPRQVLGVRIGMLAGRLLGLPLPQKDKRLLTIVETDGCSADGIAVATGCTVGHRTLRVEDYGKIAATFVDTMTKETVRIVPRPDIRKKAAGYTAPGSSHWEAHLYGYQRMPDDELLDIRTVRLVVPVEKIVSAPRRKAICASCGEEVNNEREVVRNGVALCRPCAGDSYYEPDPSA